MFKQYIKDIDWKKMCSARSIMHLFWYQKWERFEWVIKKTIEELAWKEVDENFLYIVDTSTWGRPKKDYFLTQEACYFILKNCDQRKSEIINLYDFFQSSKLEDIKDINKSKKMIFYSISILILIIVLFYLVFFNIKTVSKNIDIENQNILNTQETFSEKINKYISNWVWEITYFNDNLNPRSNFSKSLFWEDLIKSYFVFWNNWFYRESCSLLSQKLCNSGSIWNLSWFTNFWQKTFFGYELLDVYEVEENRYCVKYKYKLKNDISWQEITEIFNFTTETIDWVEQINARFCEKITKWDRNIKCPFELSSYFCINN